MNQLAVTTATNQQIVTLSEAERRVAGLLIQNEKSFSAALAGRKIPIERFRRTVMTIVSSNPDLAQCTPVSLLLACYRVAQLGLEPDPIMGQAWLIPRKGKAEFQLGYRGALELASRDRRFQSIRYNVVRDGERFEWTDGKSFHLYHEPGVRGWPEKWPELVAAWAVIDLKGGGQVPRVMYQAEIERHKKRGQGSQPAWSTDLAALAVKTVIFDICKRYPMQADIAQAFGLDAMGDAGEGQPMTGADPQIIDVEAIPKETSKSDLFKRAHGKPGDLTDEEKAAIEAAEFEEANR